MKRIIFALFFMLCGHQLHAHQIAIIGCGYVGLTLAATLVQAGHSVACVEKDVAKVDALNNKSIYIYEPYLEAQLFDRSVESKISFYHSLEQVKNCSLFFICVPTPIDASGAFDRSALFDACREVAFLSLNPAEPVIMCIKSTILPGTMADIKSLFNQMGASHIDLVYNPEFLREGSALRDMCSNPIVLGSDSQEALDAVESVYAYLDHDEVPFIKTTFETAEMIKYAWNGFSAIRIAYANELALLCRSLQADIKTVIQGFALSECLLPTASIKPGPGFGGSCLPKDTRAFATLLEQHGNRSSLIHQAIASNQNHKNKLIHDIFTLLGQGKKVALLGLAFKANTNDIRNSPALAIIPALLDAGIEVSAYDPQAVESMKVVFPHVEYYDCPYRAIQGADCVVVLTEWQEIKNLDLELVAAGCRSLHLIDTRNILNTDQLKKCGFQYLNMGAL